jgi:hypothetical protein
MKVKTAHGVAKSLLIDVDNVICGVTRPPEERHSAMASAAVLTVRLFCGVCINMARIADALDKKGEEEPLP